jgi:hypothetical protein
MMVAAEGKLIKTSFYSREYCVIDFSSNGNSSLLLAKKGSKLI